MSALIEAPCLLFTGKPNPTIGLLNGVRIVEPTPATFGKTSKTDVFRKFPVTLTNSGAIL